MIDIHFHCLPGIDDGPSDQQDAVRLCKAALVGGVTTIVATPHVMRPPWLNEDRATLDRLVQELNLILAGRPQIILGSEVYFTEDIVDLWQSASHGPLVPLNDGSHLLIEFPARTLPRTAESVFHELIVLGVTPVIAHPERNFVLAQSHDRLQRLIEIGALSQVTAGSLTGAFGRSAYDAAELFLKRGLVHAIASDSHSVEKRPPLMMEARRIVRRKFGSGTEETLFDVGPEAIVGTLIGGQNAEMRQ